MYEKVNHDEVPKRGRKVEYRFEATPEWRAMKLDLDNGLKKNDSLKISLTEADKAKYNIASRRTVVRFLQKYLTDNGLKYTVRSFNRDGLDFVVVER